MEKDHEALSQQLQQLSTGSPKKLSESQRLLLSLAGKSPAPQKIYSGKHPSLSENPEFQKLYQRDCEKALKLKEQLRQMISKETADVN